ncbi:MAG: hypothetical protein ACK45W_03245, partial [Pseudanabaena sp.]
MQSLPHPAEHDLPSQKQQQISPQSVDELISHHLHAPIEFADIAEKRSGKIFVLESLLYFYSNPKWLEEIHPEGMHFLKPQN